MARQVAFVKQYRQLLQFGTFWRLRSPFEGNETAWMTVSPDRSTALVGDYRVLQQANAGYRRLPLAGLDPDRLYQVTRLGSGAQPAGAPLTAYGDELMAAGLVTTGEDPAAEGSLQCMRRRGVRVQPDAEKPRLGRPDRGRREARYYSSAGWSR